MSDVETMTSCDLLEAIKTTIKDFEERQRALGNDIVRILKIKQGLLLADPYSATETLAQRGIDYEGAKVEMESTLENLRDSINDDTIKISRAVSQYLDAEKPEEPSANESNTMDDIVLDSFPRPELDAELAQSPKTVNRAPLNHLNVSTSTTSGAAPSDTAHLTLQSPVIFGETSKTSHDTGVQRNADVAPPSHQPEELSDESDDTLDHSYSQLWGADNDGAVLDVDYYVETQKTLEQEDSVQVERRAADCYSPINSMALGYDLHNLSSNKRRCGEDTYRDFELSGLHSRKKRSLGNAKVFSTANEDSEGSSHSTVDDDDTSDSEVSIAIKTQHPPPISKDPIYQAYQALGITKHHLLTNDDVADKYTQLCEHHPTISPAIKRYTAALDTIANSRKSLYLLSKKFKKAAAPEIPYKLGPRLESPSSVNDDAPRFPHTTGDPSKVRNTTLPTLPTRRWADNNPLASTNTPYPSRRRENPFAPESINDFRRRVNESHNDYHTAPFAQHPHVPENPTHKENAIAQARNRFAQDAKCTHPPTAVTNSPLFDQRNLAPTYRARSMRGDDDVGDGGSVIICPRRGRITIASRQAKRAVMHRQHQPTFKNYSVAAPAPGGSKHDLGLPALNSRSFGSPILGYRPSSSVLGTLGDATDSSGQATVGYSFGASGYRLGASASASASGYMNQHGYRGGGLYGTSGDLGNVYGREEDGDGAFRGYGSKGRRS